MAAAEPVPGPAPTAWRWRAGVVALFVAALGVRLLGIDWDQGAMFHPDERRIAQAVLEMSFSPLQLDPHFFAYGSLPLVLTRAACSLGGLLSPWFLTFGGVVLTGRALSALWGALTVVLAASLGRRLGGERAGLLAGGLLAMAVLHVQNSHFATVDVPLACLATAALLLAVRVLDGGGPGRLALAGLVVGFALATKVSAAPLLLPLGLAPLLRWGQERRWARAVAWAALAGVSVAAGFLLGEPYALLSWRAFLREVAEQAVMVRHAGWVPYTTQYVGTIPVVYELEQLALWGLGPLLGLAALAGVGAAAARARRGVRAEWLLLAFAVPLFAVTASFQVRFPRYLLPLYPSLAAWAAVWLDVRVSRGRAGRVARAAVLAGTALYLAAFCRIYTREHTVVAASRWFAAHVPEQAWVLSQHWDEGFPLPSLDRRPAESVLQFPFYDSDTPEKVASLTAELDRRDWIVLQTRRLYGAVLRAPGRYPYTGNFFRELFAGDLGFAPVYEAMSRPGLGGLELPDELADESFTVYDHPKVLVFARRERLDARTLEARIRGGLPSRPLSLPDVLRAGPGRTPPGRAPLPEVGSSWAAVLRLAVLVELLGLAAFALLRAALPDRPGLYALAKVLGPLVASLAAWEAVALGWLPLSGVTVLAAALALLAAGAVAARRGGRLPTGRELWATEVVFWAAFAVFLGLRAANPEVFWGEKPMDFAFLNTLYRAEALPPPEPWFAGTTLSYTYFGHFLVAGLGRALVIAPAVMFNLGIGLAAGLLAVALLAAGAALGGRLRVGVAAVFLGLACGNLAGPWAWLQHRALSFDTFWSTTRVIPDTINEFPFWSLVFADLHAHVLAMPWAVALLAVVLLLAAWPRDVAGSTVAVRALGALAAVLFAALVMTNGWGAPAWGAAVATVLTAGWWASSRGAPSRARLAGTLERVVLPAVAVVAGAMVLAAPFWVRFVAPDGHVGWHTGPGASPPRVGLIFGSFLVLLVPCLVAAWRGAPGREGGSGRRVRLASAAALAVLAAAALVDLRALAAGRLAWAPSVAAAALAVALLGAWVAATTKRHGDALVAALGALAAAIVAGCELVVVWDRMNTVFKLYLDAWLLLAVAAAPLLVRLLERGGGRWRAVWRGAVAVALAVALATAWSGAVAAVTHHRVDGPRPTLDGTAYLRSTDAEEARAVAWVNRHVPGTPTVAEAFGPSYEGYGRVSMHTGLPAVLGWEYHVYQRGRPWHAVNARKAALATIYTSPSRDEVAEVLRRLGVALVWVGDEEREAYGTACEDRFLGWPELLTPLVASPGVAVLGVRDQLVGAPLAPLPSPETGAALASPRGLAVDAVGRLVVADAGRDRVTLLDANLVAERTVGRPGAGDGELRRPADVAVTGDGGLLVADTGNRRVVAFDATGTFLRTVMGGLARVQGVACDTRTGSFYLATSLGNVVRFAPSGAGAVLKIPVSGPGGASEPTDIAVLPDGRVAVADVGTGRVVVCDAAGAVQGGFAVPGWTRFAPVEARLGPGPGRLWVTVPAAGEVRAYTPEGRLLTTLQGVEQGFTVPSGVAEAGGFVYVADLEGRLVKVRAPRRP